MPPISRNIPSWARVGATPLKSSATVSPRFSRWTSIVPEPAIVDMKGSTTVIANAVATAASTALPPRSRIAAPTEAPSGCSAATRPRGASGVCLVTVSRDWIIGGAPCGPGRASGLQVLRDVHDPGVVHEETPALRVEPRLLRVVVLHLRPEAARELLDLGRVLREEHGRSDEQQDQVPLHADRHLTGDPEGRHVERVRERRIAGEVLRDPLVHLVVPPLLLVERRLVSGVEHHPGGPDLLGGGPLRRAALLRGKRPTPGEGEHEGGDGARVTAHGTDHIRADSRTMPRSTTRATCARRRPVSTGTSGLSASWRRRSMSRRIARIRSPSWPPKASSTIPSQSSSPEAQRKTAGMNPPWTPTGIWRWRWRCASWMVWARPPSSASRRRSFGRLRRNSRARATSPERDSSMSAEHSAAASAPVRSSKRPRKTLSATSSSLS